MADRRFVCRCEDVTVGEIEHARSLGLAHIEEIKRYTGLGTGPCQGKECLASLARLLAKMDGNGSSLQPFTPRPPLEAVTFGALASVSDDTCIARAQAEAERESGGKS
jgi:sarcosine oxidase subunit beta